MYRARLHRTPNGAHTTLRAVNATGRSFPPPWISRGEVGEKLRGCTCAKLIESRVGREVASGLLLQSLSDLSRRESCRGGLDERRLSSGDLWHFRHRCI